MKACKCGCGRNARRKWATDACRQRENNAKRTPAGRRAYAQERLLRMERMTTIATHQVMATVHRADDDDNIDIVRRIVKVPVPTYGIWGY
jgi:hypothetical protein